MDPTSVSGIVSSTRFLLRFNDMLTLVLPVSTGCGPNDFVADIEEEDKFLFIERDNYYGHPNPKRAENLNDPRQCVWRSQTEPSDADYTAPIVNTPASTGGLIEYAYDHFGGQLRGNLIASMYQGPLLRVILDPSGEGVIPQSNPPLLLVNADTSSNVGEDGLDVTQAPNGNLVECRVSDSTIYVHKPVEPTTSAMSVKGVFPHRGSTAGGSILDIYGVNFSGTPTVVVGGQSCPVTSTTSTKIECTIPPGTGLVDVVVTIGQSSSTFSEGYRYITGQPAGPPTNSPTAGPTTIAPTTSPTTIAPVLATSPPAVTTGPTTLAPSTSSPTTLAPTTGMATLPPTVSPPVLATVAPTTLAPVMATLSPTTFAPTSAMVTSPPTSLAPTDPPVAITAPPTTLVPTGAPIANTSQPTGSTPPAYQQAFDYAIANGFVSVGDQPSGEGSAQLNIRLGETDVQNSVFGWRSQLLRNTGGKRIAAAFIDLTKAMFLDAVFDPDGSGGDDVGKPLNHDWGTTETLPISIGSYIWSWLPARNDPAFNPSAPFDPNDLSNVNNLFVDVLSDSGRGADGGFRGELILFRDFDSGEEYEFSQDVDPNSIAGLRQGTVGQHAEWDVGGISGAELIHSEVTILFGDGSVASGTISSDGSNAGGIAVISNDLDSAPGLSVDGFTAPASGTYTTDPSSVVVSAQPRDTVRVSMVSAFDPTDNFEFLLANALTPEELVTARLEAQYPNFPVTNARSWQHIEVVIPASGSVDIGSRLQYSNDFALGFTAVVIDQTGSPTSFTTDPIRILHV